MKPFYESVNGKQLPHNPSYKLVMTTIYSDKGFVDIVYGETNEGHNAGLELYFKRKRNGQHYHSRRYDTDSFPNKYLFYYECLKQFVMDNEVKDGHQLIVEMPLV